MKDILVERFRRVRKLLDRRRHNDFQSCSRVGMDQTTVLKVCFPHTGKSPAQKLKLFCSLLWVSSYLLVYKRLSPRMKPNFGLKLKMTGYFSGMKRFSCHYILKQAVNQNPILNSLVSFMMSINNFS